jgi:hypothetical protein
MMTLIALLAFSGDVNNLAHDDYLVRERAEQRLTRHAWIAFRACDRRFTDREQSRRAARVCDAAFVIPADVLPIQCLFSDPECVFTDRRWGYIWTTRRYYDPPSSDYVAETIGSERWCAGYLRRADANVSNQCDLNFFAACWVGRSEDATRLFARDLIRWGAPRCVVSWFVGRRASPDHISP